MQNQYLEVLELMPGATKAQVKSAYRRLSKIYHPDVSKDENAKAKFIEINEAYKFLMAVGPRPATIQSAAPTYDYDSQNHAYDEWRKKARKFAQQRTKEAIRRQQILIKSLLSGFEFALVATVIFNVLLILDSYSPLVAFSSENVEDQTILKSSSMYYDILKLNGHTMHLMKGELDDIRGGEYNSAIVHATPLFDKPIYLDLIIKSKSYRFMQYAGVYGFFSFFSKAILFIAFLYRVVVRSLDSQLSFAILLLFLSSFQLYMFLKY